MYRSSIFELAHGYNGPAALPRHPANEPIQLSSVMLLGYTVRMDHANLLKSGTYTKFKPALLCIVMFEVHTFQRDPKDREKENTISIDAFLRSILSIKLTQNDPKTTNQALQPPSGGSFHSTFFDGSVTTVVASIDFSSIAVSLALELIESKEKIDPSKM
ncbi:predicted protein [Lichtheimia corymbifera JMRC:FSU:9682]|uniref:Uncharacterized protein n=1 Tax=Lichtheimia corymbifera JMRC:FSU:9682 TaxID=1263082 RepID=A0A068RQR2_9FUNG|nr:predicted protein [Lichtheimia corymbifera JMRC:FSU:9682]